MNKTDVYFCGSIRGGQNDQEVYGKMIEFIEKKGCNVPTRHVGIPQKVNGEEHLTEKDIYVRDMAWLNNSQCMIAEITQPSHGVGYEVAMGVNRRIPILALWRSDAARAASAMIKGCPTVEFREYKDVEEGISLIGEFLERVLPK